ncbi:hypothetical protein ETB55_23440, partial [Salmonella enterica subsp. enterica serovar Omuna]|nr:hypothetical protein [Salmonella enterica subsp. enterica serovar Omuna]
LKVGGSFVVIHAGGVDIVGPKINLNGGGNPGEVTPIIKVKDNKEKKIVSTSWSYGEDQTELNDISRHYVDLNLHIQTEGYSPGESVSCDVEYNDIDDVNQVITVAGIVDNNGNACVCGVFRDVLMSVQ